MSSGDTRLSPVRSESSTDVEKVDVLKGLIVADVLHSSSATEATDRGFESSSEGSYFKGLIVDGQAVTEQVEPNTRIDLKGVGYVVLNEQFRNVGVSSMSLGVNALHLVVNQSNEYGIEPGSGLVVADATSSLAGPVAGTVGGAASGTRVSAGRTVLSPSSFLIGQPCFGTDGQTRNNGGDSASLPDVFEARRLATSSVGRVDRESASAETTSYIESARILGELLEADRILAHALAETNGKDSSFSDGKSSFGSLKVTGFPEINADVAANTRVMVPRLGFLYLHRVLRSPGRVEIRMIELFVTQPNEYGLAYGTDVRVGVASAIAR